MPGKEPSYAFYAWPSPASSISTAPSPTNAGVEEKVATQKKGSLTVPGQQEVSTAPKDDDQDTEEKEKVQETLENSSDNNNDKEPKDIALPVSPLPSSPVGQAPPASSPFPSSASAPTKQAGEGREQKKIAFVYACPSASPVRNRMLFSTCVRGLIRGAEERCGVKVSKKVRHIPFPSSTGSGATSQPFRK